ncbi:glycosyltransferase [Haloarcula argentinensis]|uniref:Glycosyltransferase n=1 Tax=Haloarcula argentinensis TaxID=43776 RepID=A0ABU2F089_HALAR|nr:glycosyltransferase [Haloarcula argentinensis]MDS0253970.1 glycosyltransferase [Haloarcula argentinensis]
MTDSPSVLHVISGIDVGGAENHLLMLLDGLSSRGFDVTVAYLKGDGELASDFREAGCSVERIGIRSDFDPLGFGKLVTKIVRNDYDLVHTHLFHGDIYGATAATVAGVPAIISSKHNDPPYWQEQPYKLIHDLSLSRTDRVLPISEHVRDYLLETSRISPNQVQTVRYGISPTEFDGVSERDVQSVRRDFVDDNTPLVGTVARLTEQKNLETLLRAFEQVKDRVPDAHLAIVGRGEEEDRLKRLAETHDIEDDVTFSGFRTDIPELMHAFDVFALPSLWEGFGVVFLEAMAAQTPVVASEVSAIPEVVADGETGLLCPPMDEAKFADAISTLLETPEMAESMGKAGRERLDREFAVDRMIEEVATIYQDTLSSKSQ